VPALQLVHADIPPAEAYVPAGQPGHAAAVPLRSVYVPIEQGAQVSADCMPMPVEYVPAPQAWH
jgi:hypothetical protein